MTAYWAPYDEFLSSAELTPQLAAAGVIPDQQLEDRARFYEILSQLYQDRVLPETAAQRSALATMCQWAGPYALENSDLDEAYAFFDVAAQAAWFDGRTLARFEALCSLLVVLAVSDREAEVQELYRQLELLSQQPEIASSASPFYDGLRPGAEVNSSLAHFSGVLYTLVRSPQPEAEPTTTPAAMASSPTTEPSGPADAPNPSQTPGAAEVLAASVSALEQAPIIIDAHHGLTSELHQQLSQFTWAIEQLSADDTALAQPANHNAMDAGARIIAQLCTSLCEHGHYQDATSVMQLSTWAEHFRDNPWPLAELHRGLQLVATHAQDPRLIHAVVSFGGHHFRALMVNRFPERFQPLITLLALGHLATSRLDLALEIITHTGVLEIAAASVQHAANTPDPLMRYSAENSVVAAKVFTMANLEPQASRAIELANALFAALNSPHGFEQTIERLRLRAS